MRYVSSAISTLAIGLAAAFTANAATFNVTTTNDTRDDNPGDGICANAQATCSLRAAIDEANALAGPDTILLIPGVYDQTLVAPNEDANAGGDWDITSVITITGSGESNCTLEAAGSPGMANERVLDVRPSGSLTLSYVTVRNGNFSGQLTAESRGAGIENLGILVLTIVTVRDNNIASGNGNPYGGAIYNAGTSMTLNGCSITANSVSLQGAGNAFGGGIASTSETTITITNSFIGNTAFANVGFVFGAGLYLEGRFTVNMSGTAVAQNSSSGTSGNNGSGVSAISNAGAAVFNATGCIFRNNSAAGSTNGQGVGLYFLTIGAGSNTLTSTLDGVWVKENIGTSSGVGIGATVNGGDLTVNILNSSITDNIGGLVGGGIDVTDAGNPDSAGLATFNLTNTTLSHNVTNGTAGGLILQGDRTSANLNYVTVAANSADSCGGICAIASTINIKNSVVGDNVGGTIPDIGGSIMSGDYNHFESTAGATISGTTTHNATGDALLGPRVEYVGGRAVHLPDVNSPVLNTIPIGINGCGTSVTVDQRGVNRGLVNACDKGAVERAVIATISGRVTASEGMGIRNAIVTLTGGNLTTPIVTQTGSFGWYSFPNLPAEQSYSVRVASKRFQFSFDTRGVYLTSDQSNVDFTAELFPGRRK